jgi:hypothetical protein
VVSSRNSKAAGHVLFRESCKAASAWESAFDRFASSPGSQQTESSLRHTLERDKTIRREAPEKPINRDGVILSPLIGSAAFRSRSSVAIQPESQNISCPCSELGEIQRLVALRGTSIENMQDESRCRKASTIRNVATGRRGADQEVGYCTSARPSSAISSLAISGQQPERKAADHILFWAYTTGASA